MNKAKRLLSTIFVSALLLLIGIVASPEDCFAAGGASGTFGEVPWQVTTDGVLQIGDDGGEYELPSTIGGNNWPWYGERADIKGVEVHGTIHGYGSIRGMFYGFQNCSSMNLSGFDTSNVTDMGDMFIDCESLTSLGFPSSFSTSNVTNMSGMFCGCKSLSSLDLSGFNTQNVTNMLCMFYDCSKLTSLDLSSFNTQNVTNMNSMFYDCRSLTSIDVSSFNTSNVAGDYGMGYMFEGCWSLTSLDLSNFNTSNVANMGCMFDGCRSLTSLNISNFNTQNVTNMYAMFRACYNLTSLSISNFNTSNVADMSDMFNSCIGLGTLNLSNFNTENVTNMGNMFKDCRSLASLNISNFNTSKVTNMFGMFRNCYELASLDVSQFDTPIVSNMSFMFYDCSSLSNITVSGFNTENVTNMMRMFQGCAGLSTLDVSGFNTENVTNMGSMFSDCTGLRELDLSGFNTTNVTDMSFMFYDCSSLSSIKVSGFVTENVTNMMSMFNGCSSLTSLDVSKFNTSSVIGTNMSGMFTRCTGLRTLKTPDWSGSSIDRPRFPLRMKNTETGEKHAANAMIPAAEVTTYEALEIIIDGDKEQTVYEDTFEEVAGTEMDLVIQGDNIQWTFHGEDVERGSGKDIDVTTRIHREKGEDMGFDDDNQVLVIDFADNGRLPAEAEIQVVNDYISEQKTGGINQLKLSYVSGSQITLEDGNVPIEGDDHDTAIFTVDHNSSFVLSTHNAVTSLKSATVIVSNCIYNGKEQKPSITVKLRGKKLDPKYYSAPQYSANKAVGTATVRVTGNSDFGYKGTATGTFYINPKQAKISKLKVGKKKITVKMKTKPASLGATKYLIEYRIAGTGNWKSVTAKGKSKVIKKLKKRKKYEVRVIAVNGARKGPASATKRSKKIK